MWKYFFAIADGLDLLAEAEQLTECVDTTDRTIRDLSSTWKVFRSNPETPVEPESLLMRKVKNRHKLQEFAYPYGFETWLDFSLAVSNVSLSYELCLNASDQNLVELYHYVRAYQSISNYMIYFLPNLISYAFVFN